MFDRRDILDELVERCREVAGYDVRTAGGDELLAGVVSIERARNLLEASEAHWLAELDARDLTDVEHGMRTASWVAREAGVAPASTRQRLRVANTLRTHLPRVDEALSSGELSWDHARALALAANPRVLDALANVQDELIDASRDTTFDRWRGEVRRLVDLVDQDGPGPADDPSTNRATMSQTLDGVVHLQASFTADLGAILQRALDEMTDELVRRATRDHELTAELAVPPRPQLRALALVELLRRRTGREGDATTTRTTRAPHAEVSLLLHDADVTDQRGRPVPPTAAKTWCCDAAFTAVLVDSLGVPLEVGREQRRATPAQRRAVAVRDGGCVCPGCEAPVEWCDVHHVDWWEHGGRTDLANLALLCRHHHTVTHRPGWTMRATADQWFWWSTPSGITFWSQRHGRRRTGPTPGGAHASETAAA